ncbi:MAG: DinB family protein [Flavobacteriaceae bacterium]
MKAQRTLKRRTFLRNSGIWGVGALIPGTVLAVTPTTEHASDSIHEFGKREGYSGEISILISMMDWMRSTILRSVRGMSQKEMDFLLDDTSNSIGAMLLHLAATERYYQWDTFMGVPKKVLDFGLEEAEWDAASSLGNKGRQLLKGKPTDFYLDKLAEVREFSKEHLKTLGDDWLYEGTRFFGNQRTNNYCKWFHVVEHESNHNGQIKYIRGRIA